MNDRKNKICNRMRQKTEKQTEIPPNKKETLTAKIKNKNNL